MSKYLPVIGFGLVALGFWGCSKGEPVKPAEPEAAKAAPAAGVPGGGAKAAPAEGGVPAAAAGSGSQEELFQFIPEELKVAAGADVAALSDKSNPLGAPLLEQFQPVFKMLARAGLEVEQIDKLWTGTNHTAGDVLVCVRTRAAYDSASITKSMGASDSVEKIGRASVRTLPSTAEYNNALAYIDTKTLLFGRLTAVTAALKNPRPGPVRLGLDALAQPKAYCWISGADEGAGNKGIEWIVSDIPNARGIAMGVSGAQSKGPAGIPGGAMPPGGMPAGGMPAGGMPAGGMPAGGMPAGGMPPGGMPKGAQPPGGPAAGNAPTTASSPASGFEMAVAWSFASEGEATQMESAMNTLTKALVDAAKAAGPAGSTGAGFMIPAHENLDGNWQIVARGSDAQKLSQFQQVPPGQMTPEQQKKMQEEMQKKQQGQAGQNPPGQNPQGQMTPEQQKKMQEEMQKKQQGQAGQNPPGQVPPGQNPAGQGAPGQMTPEQKKMQEEMQKKQQGQAGQNPPGQIPPGQVPPGQVPPGQNPAGQGAPGQMTPEQKKMQEEMQKKQQQGQPGQNPPGQVPPGQIPPGQAPPGGMPGMPGNNQSSPALTLTRTKENLKLAVTSSTTESVNVLMLGKLLEATGVAALDDGLFEGTLSLLNRGFHEWEQAKPNQLVGTRRMGSSPINLGYSWMTDLLPYVGYNDLYSKFNFNKSWADPANLQYVHTVIPAFLNPADSRTTWVGYPYQGMALSHFAGMSGIEDGRNVVAAELKRTDPRAGIFGYEEIAKPSQITDGTSQTIMVVGTGAVAAPWVQGGGATIRGARQPYFDKFTGAGSRGLAKTGTLVLFADGSARMISSDIDPEIYKSMCTMHGAEQIDLSKLVSQGP